MKQWQQIIDKHNGLVQKHVEFLESTRRNNGQSVDRAEDDNVTELLQLCFKQTAIMTQNIQMLQARLQLDNQEDDTGSVKSAEAQDQASADMSSKPRAQATEVKIDETGLFMTDTNPTPVDQLLRQKSTTATIRTKEKSQTNSRVKRKSSEGAASRESLTNGNEGEEPTRKRKRLDVDTEKKMQTMNAKAQPPGQQSNEDDSFVKEVAARIHEKEKKRQKKDNKKRKRDSGDSIQAKSADVKAMDGQQPTTKNIEKPKKKRHKKNKTRNAER